MKDIQRRIQKKTNVRTPSHHSTTSGLMPMRMINNQMYAKTDQDAVTANTPLS